MDEVPSDTYFCRAEYNLKKGILEPPITDWNKTCNCKKPLNPVISCIYLSLYYRIYYMFNVTNVKPGTIYNVLG